MSLTDRLGAIAGLLEVNFSGWPALSIQASEDNKGITYSVTNEIVDIFYIYIQKFLVTHAAC